MKNRRSTRSYKKKDIPLSKLEKILKAGQLSPSGADQKPFTYIVIDDPEVKRKIQKSCELSDKKYFQKADDWFKDWMKERRVSLKKDFITDAPFLVVIAGETDKPYWLESTWISITYFILAAEYEGLATLTYTPSETEFLIDLLKLSKGLKPVCIIPVGYKEPS